jgi:hypothetical protein
MDEARALADGWTQAEIDAEKARRAAAAPKPAAPEPSMLSQAGDAAKWIAQQPVDLVSGIKRSVGDAGRGIRQAAAYVAPGMVDPEAARQAQAAVEAEDKANPKSMAHDAGKLVGDIAPWFVGAGMVPRVAAAVPKVAEVAGMLPKWAQTLAGGAGAGAAQGALAPEAGEYDLPTKAATGAGWGAAMGPVGWLAGKAYAPFRGKGSAAAQENAAVLNAAGIPHQLPSNQSDSKITRFFTEALAQVPILGHTLNRKRGENQKWLTGKFNEATGMPEGELTPNTLDTMWKRVNTNIDRFKEGPNVPTFELPGSLKEVGDELKDIVTIKSKAAELKRLAELERQLTPTANNATPPRPGIFDTIEQNAVGDLQPAVGNTLERVAAESGPTALGGKQIASMPPVTQPVVQNTGRTAREMMELRNEAAAMAHGTTEHAPKERARAVQTLIEQAIKDTHGDKGAAFDLAMKRYGAMKDTRKAAGEMGENLVEGSIPTSRMAQATGEFAGMFPQRDRLVAAAAGNMPTPPPGSNRALYTAALMASPFAGGLITKGAGGDFDKGSVGTGALAASLIAGLSRQTPSKQKIDAFRRMMMAGGIGADPFN